MQKVVLRGQGSAGRNGGPAGDLYIEVRVKSHPIFTRDGNDVYCDVPISFTEAALGAEIDVPVLGDKTEKFNLPEGTQSGTAFTLKGKGIQDINNPRRRGDLIFTVNVETPKNLTSEQKKILRSFAETLGESGGESRRESIFKKIFGKG